MALRTSSVYCPAPCVDYCNISSRPKTGTLVQYKWTQGVQDIYDDVKLFGWKLHGVIGDDGHLCKCGGHTPWCKGKKLGWLYAVDFSPPDDISFVEFEKWYVSKLRAGTWKGPIDFINIRNSQYGETGADFGWSGDYHCHTEIDAGYEYNHLPVIRNFMEDIMGFTRDDVKVLASTDGFFDAPRVDDNGNAMTEEEVAASPGKTAWMLKSHIKDQTEKGRLNKKAIRELTEKVDAMQRPTLTQEQLDYVVDNVVAKLAELRFVPTQGGTS